MRLLVIVDLLLRNQLIQCLFRVFGDDSVNFSGRILNGVNARKYTVTQATDQLLHIVAQIPKYRSAPANKQPVRNVRAPK